MTRLGLGGLFVSKHGATFEEARKAVIRAVELGINYVDTAPGYRDSEEVLGRILRSVDAPLVISTKLGGRPVPFDPKNRDALMSSLKESLRLLGRDHVDILMIHEPDRPGQYDWWDDREAFDGPVMEVLARARKEGLCRFTGLGGTTAYELPRIMATGGFDVVLTAFNYSLLWREAVRKVLPEAARQGMGVITGSPLQQGALAARYDSEIASGAPWLSPPRREQYRALYRFCDEAGWNLPELALRFVISNPVVDTTLSGARSAAEIESSFRAIEKGPLPPEAIRRLDEIANMVPYRPFEEPFGLPFGSRTRYGPGEAR